MTIDISQVGPDALDGYGEIHMRYRVESILRVDLFDNGLGGIERHGCAGDPRVAHETMLLWYLDL